MGRWPMQLVEPIFQPHPSSPPVNLATEVAHVDRSGTINYHTKAQDSTLYGSTPLGIVDLLRLLRSPGYRCRLVDVQVLLLHSDLDA